MNTLCQCPSAMPSLDSTELSRAGRVATRITKIAIGALAVLAMVYGGAFSLQHDSGSTEYAAATYLYADNQGK